MLKYGHIMSPELYTVQELQLKSDTIQSFESVVHLKEDLRIVQLGSESFPEVELGDEGNANFALINRSEPCDLERQWTGRRASDYAIINTQYRYVQRSTYQSCRER